MYKMNVQLNSSSSKRKSKSVKKSNALSKKEKKQVVKIAKSVVKRNLERKYYISGIEDTFLGNFKVYAVNPLAGIVAGTLKNQRIGERIQNVKLRFKFYYNHMGDSSPSSSLHITQDSQVRILVIRTKRALTTNTSSWADLTNVIGKNDTAADEDNCLFYMPTAYNLPYNGTLSDIKKDNNFEVLYDKVKTAKWIGNGNNVIIDNNGNPYSSALLYGTTAMWGGNVKIPQCEYNVSNQYLNNKNTYIVVVPVSRALVSTGRTGWLTGQYSVQYTDA